MSLDLSKIEIENFKSIDEISLDITKIDNSYTTVFVGKNETGKSNLLNSIQYIEIPQKELNYEELRNSQNDNADYVDFYYTYTFSSEDEWKNILKEKVNVPIDFLENINIKEIRQNVYLAKGEKTLKHLNNIIFDEINKALMDKYCYIEVKNKEEKFIYEIILKSELPAENQESETTNEESSEKQAKIEYKDLSNENLSQILKIVFQDVINNNKLTVSQWKYSKEYLITDTIDLNIFKTDCSICYPLKNIFNLAGYETQEKITEKIDELEGSPKNINKLEKKLEQTLSDYVKKIWAESKIRFEIKIQNDLKLDVFIFDEADKDNSYYMYDRSEGFKQFVSLILSISAANETDTLKNHVILIDEPEVHMHPSGIRYMRSELLRIGENNYVFIATHSQFMIDTKNKERHYIVSKPNNNTCVKLWDSTKDLADDEILRQAFGINVLNDLLSPYKMLVEGFSDWQIFSKALHEIEPNNCITITNGTGSNIIAVASMLKMYNVPVLTLVDADKEGEKYKKEITKLGDPFNTNMVKTLRDFVAEIIEYGTIEDTLNKDFVIKCLEKAYKEITAEKTFPFVYNEEKAILEEFKIFLNIQKIDKDTIDEILEIAKCKMGNDFNPTKNNLKTKHPKLLDLCNKIIAQLYNTPL